MKGDKGRETSGFLSFEHELYNHGKVYSDTVSVEFAGTLLGFDDYVSQSLRFLLLRSSAVRLGRVLIVKAKRHGPRGCDGIVSKDVLLPATVYHSSGRVLRAYG